MIPFSIEEGKDSGTLLSAIRQHGKTKLAQTLATKFLIAGCNVRVFDTSRAWDNSNLATKVILYPETFKSFSYPENTQLIFDISRLYLDQQRFVIQAILGADFQQRANSVNPKALPWVIYVFEEAQIILPNGSLRAHYAQEAFRVISVGANYNMGYMLVTQRPADVSTKAISRCGQLFIGKHFEQNDVTKLKRFLGIRKYDEAHSLLSKLPKRDFVYFNGVSTETFTCPTYKQYGVPEVWNCQPRRGWRLW